MSYNKIILSEINRMREMMKLPLILEGGGIGGVLDNFWDNLLSKNVDELTAEERKLVDDLITSTPGLNKFKSATDALVDDVTRKSFLDAIASNADDVSKVIKNFSKGYIETSVSRLNSKLASQTDAALSGVKSELNKLTKPGALDGYAEYQLLMIKKQLEDLKKVQGVGDDILNMTDDLIGGIDDTIKASKLTANDIASKVSSTYKSIDDIIANVSKITDDVGLQEEIGTISTKLSQTQKDEINNLLVSLESKSDDELKSIIDDFKMNYCSVKESRRVLMEYGETQFEKVCGAIGGGFAKLFNKKTLIGWVCLIAMISVYYVGKLVIKTAKSVEEDPGQLNPFRDETGSDDEYSTEGGLD
jgi:hypothetical protein